MGLRKCGAVFCTRVELNKRGIFFMTLAVVLLILFLSGYTYHGAAAERKTIQTRIATMDSFLASLEADLARSAYIAGFRTLVVFEQQLAETGSYISNLNASVEEAFQNGTFEGSEQDIMAGATFADLVSAASQKAAKIGINLSLSAANLTLTQEEPWKVTATLRTGLLMEDATAIARWNKTLVVASTIDIQNFNDPLYTVATQGKITSKINRTKYEPFVAGSDASNLSKHLQNSSYTNNTDAPSFLDRVQGITTANQQGIESLVNAQRLASQGIAIQDKSMADHVYFSPQNPASSAIQGMPSWFKLDEAHVDRYGARSLSGFA